MSVAHIVRPSSLIINNCIKLGCIFSTPDSIRTRLGNKHWNEKWRKLRSLKVIKMNLPDFHKEKKDMHEMTDEEKRAMHKEMGVQPHRPWDDKPFSLNCTTHVFEPYVPPEGDGKLSSLNSSSAKQKLEWLKKKGVSWKELREIRKFDENFELYPDFVDKAQENYIKAHEILASNDQEKLIEYVTEKAFPVMLFNSTRKSIRWSFIKSLEPPRVCHIRTLEMFGKYNRFAQITVRFHSQQILAIYDRFGRLMYGSENVAKDVLEYVVFEKHLTNSYSQWRLHHKIIPDWLPRPANSKRTYKPETEEEITESKDVEPDAASGILKVPL